MPISGRSVSVGGSIHMKAGMGNVSNSMTLAAVSSVRMLERF